MLGRCDLDDLAEISPAEQMRRAAERRARLFNRPASVRAQPPVEQKPTVVAFVPRRARDPLDVEVMDAEPAWHQPHDFMAVPDDPHVNLPLRDEDTPSNIMVRHVILFAAEYFGQRPREITGDRRHRDLVAARQVAIWFAHYNTCKSLPELGRRFGNRDHTTILHAIRKIDGEIARETDLGRRAVAFETEFLRREGLL